MKQRGLWATHLGPELGGQGYGQVKLALLNEILGRVPTVGPIVFGCQAPDTGNAEILAHYGTAEQKTALPAAAPRRADLLLLLHDRAAGRVGPDRRSPAGPSSTATNGSSTARSGSPPTPGAPRSSSSMVGHRARQPALSAPRRCSIVPADTPGVEHPPQRRRVGWDHPGEGGTHAYIRYDDVRVPADQPARRAGRRLRRRPDPPRRRPHPPRHAHRRDGRAGASR